MTLQQRKKKIASYGKAYATLVRGLKKFPKKMWKFKPSQNDWSIHELIVQIADSEANSYVRCRRLLAEPESAVLGFDGDKWAKELARHLRTTHSRTSRADARRVSRMEEDGLENH